MEKIPASLELVNAELARAFGGGNRAPKSGGIDWGGFALAPAVTPGAWADTNRPFNPKLGQRAP